MLFNIFKERTKEIEDNYVIVTYDLESTQNIEKAAWDLAIGQSVGNPNVRNEWESDELFENHSCIILEKEGEFAEDKFGTMDIGFPVVNTDWENDGIAHLLCQVMGGQVDIDHIIRSYAVDIEIPESVLQHFLKPLYGLFGYRMYKIGRAHV